MRLFIGIELPAEIKQTLHEFQSEQRQLGINGAWKSLDNLHITLEFLGEIDLDKIPVLTETLTKVASNYGPFGLTIGGLGAFPSLNKPHTLWTAVGGNLTDLNSLKDELHRELKIKGFKLDERQFRPHITLASRIKLNNVDLYGIRTKILGEFIVVDVTLFESRPIHGKIVYIDLHKASFRT